MYPLRNMPSSPESANKRVAAYCRVSSESNEQLESYRAQIAYYERHIEDHPDYTLAGIYADEGISGTSTRNRESYNQMLQDARHGLIDMIITKSLSRFGRNTLDCLNSLRELKALGVDVYFEKENVHSLYSEGELLITLMSAVAQSEIVSQSENIKWGKRRKFEKGDVGSIAWTMTGYKLNGNREVIIIEEQAAIVRRVYKEFLNGYGINLIVRRLNHDHVPCAENGARWHYRQIKNLLTNEKYCGDTRFQKQYSQDPLSKRKLMNAGVLPQYVCEDSHPAIIDKDTWRLAQLELARQAFYRNEHHVTCFSYAKYTETLPLTGRIVCSHCGHSFKIRISGQSRDKGSKYYSCSQYRSGYRRPKKKGCCINQFSLRPDDVEGLVVQAWNSLVDESDRHQSAWQATMDGPDQLKAYRAKDLAHLIEEIGHLEVLPYQLMIRVLDHVKIGLDGSATVIFLSGTQIGGLTGPANGQG